MASNGGDNGGVTVNLTAPNSPTRAPRSSAANPSASVPAKPTLIGAANVVTIVETALAQVGGLWGAAAGAIGLAVAGTAAKRGKDAAATRRRSTSTTTRRASAARSGGAGSRSRPLLGGGRGRGGSGAGSGRRSGLGRALGGRGLSGGRSGSARGWGRRGGGSSRSGGGSPSRTGSARRGPIGRLFRGGRSGGRAGGSGGGPAGGRRRWFPLRRRGAGRASGGGSGAAGGGRSGGRGGARGWRRLLPASMRRRFGGGTNGASSRRGATGGSGARGGHRVGFWRRIWNAVRALFGRPPLPGPGGSGAGGGARKRRRRRRGGRGAGQGGGIGSAARRPGGQGGGTSGGRRPVPVARPGASSTRRRRRGSPNDSGNGNQGGGMGIFTPQSQEMVAAASRYNPEDMWAFLADMKALPDDIENMARAMRIMTERSGSEFPLHPALVETIGAIYQLMIKAAEGAREVAPAMIRLHEDDLRRKEAPRPGEAKWNV